MEYRVISTDDRLQEDRKQVNLADVGEELGRQRSLTSDHSLARRAAAL